MNAANIAVFVAGVALVLGGARLLWCGHRHHPHADRRRGERRMTRRGPGRRLE
jgi:hypothetical protein